MINFCVIRTCDGDMTAQTQICVTKLVVPPAIYYIHILHNYTTPSLSLSLDKSKMYNVVVFLYYIWQGEMKYLNIQDHVAFGAIPPDVEHSDEYLHTQGLVGVIQWVSYEHKWIFMLADLSLYCFRATHWSLLYLPQREQSFSWFSLSDHVIGGQIML